MLSNLSNKVIEEGGCFCNKFGNRFLFLIKVNDFNYEKYGYCRGIKKRYVN